MMVAARATADKKELCTSVVAGCDTSPILQSDKHDLDAVAAAIAPFVVADRFAARLPSGDAGAYPPVSQRIPEPVGVKAPVSEHSFSRRQTAQQGSGSGIVAELACVRDELQRPSLGVRYGVQLDVKSSLHAPAQASALIVGPPFFRPQA